MEATKFVHGESFLSVAQGAPAVNWARQTTPGLKRISATSVMEKLTSALRMMFKPIFSYKVVEFYECDNVTRLPNLPAFPALRVKTFDGTAAVSGELAALAEMHPGETLTTLYVGRKEAGYIRAGFKHMISPDTGVWVSVKPGEVYLYGLKILPEFRGRGFSKYLLVAAANAFHERGFSRIVVSKLVEQLTSKTKMENSGFRRFHLLRACKVFSKRIHIIY